MAKRFTSDIAFTDAVKAIQERRGSRRYQLKLEEQDGWQNTVSDDMAVFIGERESFYLGTASTDGQPYIQHRGGKPGFLRVLDEKTLAFANFRGNRQYITTGNLSENDKAYIFLMDYPNRYRVKIWGRARVTEDPELMRSLADADYAGVPDQAIVFEISALAVNCTQHITPRYSEAEVDEMMAPLKRRIEELESRLDGAQPDSD